MGELNHTINEAEKLAGRQRRRSQRGRLRSAHPLDDTLRTAKSDLRKLEDSIIAHSREAADTVNVYVQDNPWRAVGIGAAIGLVIGTLISRR